MLKQKTIKRSFTLSGIGLHTGKKVNITVKPAPIDHGIVFYRVDLPFGEREIKISARNVSRSELCTRLVNSHGADLYTVEHLMSAIAACFIDNLIIEINGPEVPILDGSALLFFNALQNAFIEDQPSLKKYIYLNDTVRVEDGDKWIELQPYSSFSINCTIDFNHVAIKETNQSFSFDLFKDSYVKEIGKAKTFGFLKDLDYLRYNNLALGAGIDNTIALGDTDVVNKNILSYPDEFVRHKLLDIIGDLYLNGPLLCKVNSYKPGHHLTNLALMKLFDQGCWSLVTYDNLSFVNETVTAS